MNIRKIFDGAYRVEYNDTVKPIFELFTVNKYNNSQVQLPFYYNGYIILLSKDTITNSWYLNSVSRKLVGYGGSLCGSFEKAIERAIKDIEERENKQTERNEKYRERLLKVFQKEVMPILVDTLNEKLKKDIEQ